MSNPINLVDNQVEGYRVSGESTVRDIIQIANIGKLHNAPNLLVFPQSFSERQDGIEDLSILTTKNHVLGNDGQCCSIDVGTGNLMGFVGVNDTSISIHSRFTHRRSNNTISEGKDYFLYYMLQKVFAINVFSLEHTSDKDDKILDFLLFLFPNMLNKALSQGLYKEYRTQHHDDSHIRGVIDINSVIRRDIPFRGGVSYSNRQHSYDNSMTQLIRHTIEFIMHHPIANSILRNNTQTMESVSQIIQATPTYNSRDRYKVLNENLKPKVHPYYLRYRDLQKLCISILRHDSLKYGKEKDKVYGVLFDGAWLWEEYLYTLLKKQKFIHPRNKESKGGIRMFASPNDEEYFDNNSRRMYPDFYKKDYILDAKYKHLSGKVGREDLYQVISYMYCMDAHYGGYIYPDEGHNKTANYKLAGSAGGLLKVIPFTIPQTAKEWDDFRRDISKSEKFLETPWNQPQQIS